MLRYYSYYSVGGYKDFYLGSSTDTCEATYYLSLLPVWEKRAADKNDKELQEKVDELKKLPSIEVMTVGNSFGMPHSGNLLFSHAGYKLIYEHLEGNIHALAVRDIVCKDKDESGRQTPFLFIITADTSEDLNTLNTLAAYAAMNMHSFSEEVASMLSYDVLKNGLRFDIGACNLWIKNIVKTQRSKEIATVEKEITISAETNKVALLLIPNGISDTTAFSELKLLGKKVIEVYERDLLPFDNPKLLIQNLRSFYTSEMTRREDEASKKRLKDMAKAAGGGALAGFILAKLF